MYTFCLILIQFCHTLPNVLHEIPTLKSKEVWDGAQNREAENTAKKLHEF